MKHTPPSLPIFSYTHLYHILFGLLDGILNVQVCLCISNGVTNTNGVT